MSIPDARCKLLICELTYYWWKGEYGRLRVNQVKCLALEQENSRLKKLVADLAIDKAIMQEVAEENF